jgi:IS5 family transposase
LRPKYTQQPELDLQPSNLKLTNEYYQQYERVSDLLDTNNEVVDLIHKDIKNALKSATTKDRDGKNFRYTSDTVLRILVCQIIEGLSLRDIVIRIDDSHCLRRFVRIYSGPMMDYTTLCKLKNCISPKTWKKVNDTLARNAVQEALIEGEQLRIDTTAVETNIHWPTDSSLLWDTYRVMARLIEQSRELDPDVVGDRRLQTRKAKKTSANIARRASKKERSQESLKPLYERLIRLVSSICEWGEQVAIGLRDGCRDGRYDVFQDAVASELAQELDHYRQLGLQVIGQTTLRILHGEQVPNDAKLFSIFEPHTELLKRGKAAKPVEFGHMIQIQQVAGKFISDYDVFKKKPVEHELLQPALDRHKELFGDYPSSVAADRGYYENMAAIEELGKQIDVVAIAKKGNRTEAESKREAAAEFRAAQRFRAGVEGTISFLKRALGLWRCFSKGWEHYASTIGAAVFTHNLLNLART